MDFSKAFYTTNHSLLLAKLEAYGLSMASLKLMQSYLCNRFHRSSVNSLFSDRKEIETGVPQESGAVAPWCSGYHYCTTSFKKA